MASSMTTKKLKIDGMTCVGCENRIERKLKNTAGVTEAKASFVKGMATVTFDPQAVTTEEITQAIEGMDYHVVKTAQAPGQAGNITKTLGVAIILLAVYMILSRLGFLNIFNAFPQAEKGTGLGMLFVIGLLTSVHCVAMCGGINLSQCVPQAAAGPDGKKLASLRPGLLYNLGRVISYTVIGGIVGAIGSVVSFSGAFKGVVQLLAGVFMVIMGLNMLNIFPWLRRLNPRMPKIFARKINREKGRSNSPLYVGLLNGLMPCGPLQAMQLYALSSGSAINGALSMLLFSLGTVPLMFGLGALSSFLSQKFTHRMMRVSAVLVVLLGVFMFGSGMSLSGLSFDFPQTGSAVQSANAASIQGNTQIITSGLTSGRYEPITVQKGIPVKWTIQAKKSDLNGCNNKIVVPKYNLEVALKEGDNVIEFTPTESGTVPFSCWMGMIRSKITVVDDLASAPASTAAVNPKILADKVAVAQLVDDGTQKVAITIDKNGFSPAVVVMQSGLETEWTVNVSQPSDGNSTLLVPVYSAQVPLQEGANPLSLVPDSDFDFSTADNAFFGLVKVVDDLSSVDLAAIQKEAAEYTPTVWDPSLDSADLPSCCSPQQ
jgi:sulfite exporter TauE/SafE/copper chaperone CopZ